MRTIKSSVNGLRLRYSDMEIEIMHRGHIVLLTVQTPWRRKYGRLRLNKIQRHDVEKIVGHLVKEHDLIAREHSDAGSRVIQKFLVQ